MADQPRSLHRFIRVTTRVRAPVTEKTFTSIKGEKKKEVANCPCLLNKSRKDQRKFVRKKLQRAVAKVALRKGLIIKCLKQVLSHLLHKFFSLCLFETYFFVFSQMSSLEGIPCDDFTADKYKDIEKNVTIFLTREDHTHLLCR